MPDFVQLPPTLNVLTDEEVDSLNVLIDLEQQDIIDDEENEYWNTIRRKLNQTNHLK